MHLKMTIDAEGDIHQSFCVKDTFVTTSGMLLLFCVCIIFQNRSSVVVVVGWWISVYFWAD